MNVGRFEDQKNQITILKALKNAKYRKNFQVKFYGYGKNYNFLKSFIKSNDLNERIN